MVHYSDARIGAIVFVVLGLLICLGLWLHLENGYRRRPHTRKRWIFEFVTFMPVCFCVGAVAGVFMPASWPLWDWALKSYESFAIWKFAQLIVLICGGKGIMLTDLAEQSMRKYWAAPPCCCTAPCQDKQVFTERDYRRILRLIFQFVFLVPPLFFLQMLIFIFEADPKARLPLNAVGGISTIICMYGLATLYFAVHNLPAVQGHRLIQKFTVIKLMVLLSVLQSLIIDSAVESGSFDEGFEEEAVDAGSIVKCFLIAIEAPVIMLIALKAYPATEIPFDPDSAFHGTPLMETAFEF
mmetsp:Transcript_593/g.2173  ORF Transcript_593/g.2173 Transcript_593/m.2173 type:complete len:297 (-) Transcript_593:131-1021(-)